MRTIAAIIAITLVMMVGNARADETVCEVDGIAGVYNASGCITPEMYNAIFSIEALTIAADNFELWGYQWEADNLRMGIANLNPKVAPLDRHVGVNNEGPTVYESLFARHVEEGRAL